MLNNTQHAPNAPRTLEDWSPRRPNVKPSKKLSQVSCPPLKKDLTPSTPLRPTIVAPSSVSISEEGPVVVLSLTVEWGVGMERQDPSYGVVVHTSVYEFRPFAEEVIALRLGARRRSTGLCVYEL